MVIEWLTERRQDYLDWISGRESDIVKYKEQILIWETQIQNFKYAVAELNTVITAAEFALHEQGMDVERC